MNKYKKILMLQYFNTVGAGYSYNELTELFGMQEEQLSEFINQMLVDKLLKIEGYIKITEKGYTELSEYNLVELEFGTIEKENIILNKEISNHDIYIPLNFNSKFKSNVV